MVRPPRRTVCATLRRSLPTRSNAALRGSAKGGYKYSAAPARTARSITSASEDVFSIMTAGEAFVERMPGITVSNGSTSPEISSNMTSGRTLSIFSRKAARSQTSEWSRSTRTGRPCKAACSSSHSSLVRMTIPAVSGYTTTYSLLASVSTSWIRSGLVRPWRRRPGLRRLLSRPRRDSLGRRQHGHKLNLRLSALRLLGWLLRANQVFHPNRLLRRMDRDWACRFDSRRSRRCARCIRLKEFLRELQLRQWLPSRDRPNDFRRYNH